MFEKVNTIRANRIAFMPETLKLAERYSNIINQSLAYRIAAYWHETKAGKPIVACGVFTFELGTDTEEKLTALHQPLQHLTYRQILGVARKQPYEYTLQFRVLDGITQQASAKLGHAKRLHYRSIDEYYPELGQIHNDQELLAMQANPNYIPDGADGWYALNKKQVF